jgi:hypothetical protein
MWHYANYRLWGNLEDRMAWKGLSKQYTKEEILRELSPLGNKPKYLKWYHKDHGLVTDMSINKFCEFYGLDRRNIRRVIKKEQKSHKGWIHYTEEGILRELPPSVDKPKYLKWYHKEHGLVTNMRISELCKFYSLNKRNVYRLMKKERKSHKGWVFIDS